MNEEQHWEIQRYILGDPTLDVEQFEQQMLDNPEMALAVADEVASIHLLATCDSPSPAGTGDALGLPSSNSLGASKSPWVLLGFAASLLVCIFTWLGQPGPRFPDASSTASTRVSEASLEEFAEQWISLQVATSDSYSAESSYYVVTDGGTAGLDPSDSALELTSEHEAGNDWLLEAAQLFYSDADI